jgi:transposase
MVVSKSFTDFIRKRVVELIAQGESKEVICRVLGVTRTTINVWLKKASAGENSPVRRAPGRKPRLDHERLRQLEELLRKGPEAHGWRNNLWTSLRVREVIKRHFGVVFCRSQVWQGPLILDRETSGPEAEEAGRQTDSQLGGRYVSRHY